MAMIRRAGWTAAVLAALCVSTPLVQARDLPVPPGKGWQHAKSGLILPSTLDGMARTRLSDSTTQERDVTISFADPTRATIATLFLYRPAIASVPLWFDRAEAAIGANAILGDTAPNSADPVAFAPPGSGTASALRRVYHASKGGYPATGLAMLPMGPWLMAVRLSRKDGDLVALDQAMTRLIAAIRWPAAFPDAPVAQPVRACGQPVDWKKAKPRKPHLDDAIGASLLGLLGQAAARSQPAATSPDMAAGIWCRDDSSAVDYAVYRAPGKSGYVVALGDAGRSVSVSPAFATILKPEAKDRFTVMLEDVDSSASSYGTYDGLPRPDQVVDRILHGQPESRNEGHQVTIGVPKG